MNDFEKFLKSVEVHLEGLDEKIKNKLDKLDSVINEKLKSRGFGWDADADRKAEGNEKTYGEDSRVDVETIIINDDEDGDRAGDYARYGEDSGGNSDAEKFEKIAPYMSEKSLHNMVWEFLYGDLEMNMVGILPFLCDEDISLLTKMLLKSEGETFKGLKVKDILPFAKAADIDEIFIKRAKTGYIDREMMPFVSDDCWHEIVKDYCKDEDSTLNMDELYPYLNDEDITLLFKTYLKRQKSHKKNKFGK